MTLDYGNCGIFLIMGNAGFISSTLVPLDSPEVPWPYGITASTPWPMIAPFALETFGWRTLLFGGLKRWDEGR